jgi:phage terminase small subunit
MKSKNRQTLTPKQQRFAQEYLLDLNATQAAIRAGYSARTAGEQGSRLLAKIKVQESIQKAQEERSERTEIDQDWVIENLRNIVERCLQGVPVMTKSRGKWVETGKWKFDSAGANRALEMIAKHLGMFIEKQVIQHEHGVNALSGQALRDYVKELMSRASPEQLAQLGLGPALPDA